MSHSDEYVNYINSMTWKAKRARLISSMGYRCQKCGGYSMHLQVHHLTYERLGDERDDDLMVVCADCHKDQDAKRSIAAKSRVWNARLDGWATKRYGEDWRYWYSIDQVDEEFESWLDEHEDSA